MKINKVFSWRKRGLWPWLIGAGLIVWVTDWFVHMTGHGVHAAGDFPGRYGLFSLVAGFLLVGFAKGLGAAGLQSKPKEDRDD